MANFFKRLFNIGAAEANAALDKLEDPIKMTEQGIRNMKNDLDKSLKALAEVKALAIRSKNDKESYKNKMKDYEKKAMLLLQKAQDGSIDKAEAERLASESLAMKAECAQSLERTTAEAEKLDKSVLQLDGNIKTLRANITKWENELKVLKARAKVSTATKNLNKQMANIDSDSTINMLERMKEKVAEDEALAESYGEIANESKTLDEEIDSALGSDKDENVSDELQKLKEKMGYNK